MHYKVDDSVNRKILADSLSLQLKLPPLRSRAGALVGAQQAMPKPADSHLFSTTNPLPWVPDRVGRSFNRDNGGILIVGSSYNGFLEGYAVRKMPLRDYLLVRDLVLQSRGDRGTNSIDRALEKFLDSFHTHVMEDDPYYYDPIIRDMLSGVNLDLNRVCLTDLCKASFVQCGVGKDDSNRQDLGNDGVIRSNWEEWTKYLQCGSDRVSLPYIWLWNRILQSQFIVALGSIAEYGVLKIFNEMAGMPVISTRSSKESSVDPSLTRQKPWKYSYASRDRRMGHWIKDEDWWILTCGQENRTWKMLPVYHPSAKPPHSNPAYCRTLSPLRRMLNS